MLNDEISGVGLPYNDTNDVSAQQSSRERRPPDRLGEWVTVASEGIAEPATVNEAVNGPDADQWHSAMQQEMNSLHKHDVWNLVE